MAKSYYARMKFEGEAGFYQIQLDNDGYSTIRQWLPDTPETMALFKKWNAAEVTMEELDAIYKSNLRTRY